MREVRFILPNRDNEDIDLGLVHRALRYQLANEFGGYTTQAGTGGWLHNGALLDEPVTIYDVAGDSDLLRAVAIAYARKARQEAVYFRDDAGNVEIIPVGGEKDHHAGIEAA